jgi:hypothetical protein
MRSCIYKIIHFLGQKKKFGVEQILCVLCALCGEKSCTAKHAKSAKLIFNKIYLWFYDFINGGADVTAGYGRGWVMGMVVWVDEIVFIKEEGTRMARIRRIRTDLEILIQIFPSVNSA